MSLTPIIKRGGLFSALKDPEYFVREMRILRGGAGLTWPEEVDVSADGLRRDAFPKEPNGEYEEAVSSVAETSAPPT